MAVTIKDIGREAGVSIASVSKVLNGNYANVSAETRDNILAVAKRLNYRPNRLARGLVSNRTHMVGLIVPDIASPYFAQLAKEIERSAYAAGYKLLLCNTDNDAVKVGGYIDMLLEYNTDGVIVAETALGDAIDRLLGSGCKVATINSGVLGPEVYGVYVDNVEGTYLATRHLIERGHTHIAFIGSDNEPGKANQRLDGYMKAMGEHGLQIDYGRIKLGNYQLETGQFYAQQLLERNQRFTAIVCGNDVIAFGALNALKDNGVRVPDDVSLVGFDDVYLTTLADPKLTSVRQPVLEISRLAVGALVKLMSGEPVGEKRVTVVPTLVERHSVAAPRERDQGNESEAAKANGETKR
ncbi:LacI family DNA-binding transcriptional regulator [Paenibacillus cymbidii]|uniref:LacI family DNA-binding transcriptional regulator n=1 Tax=Paenibacillus cymbidii TaxID=1639034 RepID=UPI001081913B|nr:LacI family DNA-binding transcriptional regulator [Paenibacillus cymbidii]